LAVSLDKLGSSREAAKKYVLALNLSNEIAASFNRDIARLRLRVLTSSP
jgi:hypothetical protein